MSALKFPMDRYTEKSTTVKTRNGEARVDYKLYENIVYVEKPVLPEFQSMNVEVPARVNGEPVDTTDVPILLAVRVGAYMATKCGGVRLSFMMPPQKEDSETPTDSGPSSGKKKKGPPPPIKDDDRILGLALAAGWVVIRPGNRGRGLKGPDGTWLGKAPATIVDLKSVVRYIRHNRGVMPGNPEHIVSHGLSAGGAMSALLGASGNSPLYDDDCRKIGAAEARDDIFATGVFCPMCDLEHADVAYEWMYGPFENQRDGQKVDQEISRRMAKEFAAYQKSLGLTCRDTGEPLTADTYKAYLDRAYLIPAANAFLSEMREEQRTAYLSKYPWLKWDGGSTHFTVDDLHEDTGRLKELPAFDSPGKTGECEIFGTPDQTGENFTTAYREACGEKDTAVPVPVQKQAKLMNPLPFILNGNPGCSSHWWIRLGARDNGISFSVAGNLAAGLEKQEKDVSLKFYWDAGHYTDLDPEDFVDWIQHLTGK